MKQVVSEFAWICMGLLLISLAVFARPIEGTCADKAWLPLIGIRINNGDRFTNKVEVDVEIKSLKTPDELIDQMQVGIDPDLEGATWQPYVREPIKIQLEEGEGEKRIYVRLKDKAGNQSPIESSKIILDTSPPVNCRIVVNKGSEYSNDNLGRVLLNAYADGAEAMIISNHEDLSKGRWESYIRSKKWVLDITSEGEKTIYARFKDAAGNESEVVTTSIVYDTSPPENGEILINDGDKYTGQQRVTVRLRSDNASHLRLVSRNNSKTYDYTPDENGWMIVPWQFDSLQGIKSVRVYFYDDAGNRSKAPGEATIIYKSEGPKAPVVVLNNGQTHTNHSKGLVDIKISPREKPENWTMVLSNDPELQHGENMPFKTIITDWQLLAEEDGLKRVYVQLIDEAGNSSDISTAEIILDRTSPVMHRFVINEGAAWTNSLKVALHFDVQDAEKMQISNTASTDPRANWEKYDALKTEWALLPADGTKTVYARFMDAAGNQSEMVSANIQLDTKPPVGSILINDGDKVTNNREGVVQLNIKFEEDAMGMQIGNKPNFDSIKITPVVPVIEDWLLDGEDGPKSVFLRLQDKAGNFSQVYTAGIILDRQPPEMCSITINGGDTWVTNRNRRVTLSLRAEGARFMMISQNTSFENAEWMPFKTAVAWTLEGPEGEHQLFAKFKDQAGNESPPVSASIQSDFSAPVVNLFTIDQGAKCTNDPQKKVSLALAVDDAAWMALSNGPMRDTLHASSLWEPYTNAKDWTLEGEDGLKMVHAFFKDKAGNSTAEYSAKIILDRVPPSELGLAINNGAKWFNNPEGTAHLQLHANGASHLMLSNDPDFNGAVWEPFEQEIESWKLDLNSREAQVFARFRDEAGNVSETISSSISIDIDPPVRPSITINEGDPYVYNKDRQITLQLGIEGAQYMRISRNEQFENARWEPLADKKVIILSEPDGTKTFFAQFRDEAGNDSDIVSASIILDTTPPQIHAFTIDGGEEWTNNQEKKVTLTIEGEGAGHMMISEKVSFENMEWQPFAQKIDGYTLPGDDGEKNLYVVLKDEAGNISKPAHARIMLKRSF